MKANSSTILLSYIIGRFTSKDTFTNMQKLYTLLVCTLAFLAFGEKAYAQEPNFSMYQHTPFLTNPGMIGTQQDARVMFNYRNQSVEAGQNFSTGMISGYYPVAVGNHQLGLAGSFMSDRASDFLTTNGGMLGVAYGVNFSQGMMISLGAQGGYFQRRLDSDLTTDDQFNGGGFDPNAPSQEQGLNDSRGYATVSTGLYWNWHDENGRLKAFAGGSIFNLTQPNISFIEDGEDEMPLSFRGELGVRVFQGDRLGIMPTMRYVSQASNDFANIGALFNYELAQTENGAQTIGLGTWYNTNEAGVMSLEYSQKQFLVAASYDVPVGDALSTAAPGGVFELAISLRLGKGGGKRKKRQVEDATEDQPVEEDNTEEDNKPAEEEDKGQDEAGKAEDAEETQPDNQGNDGGDNDTTDPDNGEADETEEQGEPKDNVGNETQQPEETDKDPDATDTDNNAADAPIRLSERDQAILAENVRFKINSTELTEESKQHLNEVKGVMDRNDRLIVALTGHTCNLGAETLNKDLSVGRANIVKDYLIAQGVDANRITVSGEGEASPIDTNATEEGRKNNRRVAFRVGN